MSLFAIPNTQKRTEVCNVDLSRERASLRRMPGDRIGRERNLHVSTGRRGSRCTGASWML